MKKILLFGEVMARLSTPGYLRFHQTLPGTLEVSFGGAEANVATSLSMLGAEAAFVTALPKNAIADACIATLKGLGVDTRHILRTNSGRLGLYFLETGANQRPSNVIYDRDGSSVGLTPADQYDWEEIFHNVKWFHVSGITPAISRSAADTVIAAVKCAKESGVQISCDLNFRKKLWRWDENMRPRELAEKIMRKLLPHVDVIFSNEEDCSDILGIHAEHTNVGSGVLQSDCYPEVARKVVKQFANIRKVAITLRQSLSATHNNWGGMLYCAENNMAFFAPAHNGNYEPYQIKNIVDRVGSGDSFAAGLIFSFTTPELSEPQTALDFAVAASCLAHSISGDINYSTREEIETLMKGSASGRVVR